MKPGDLNLASKPFLNRRPMLRVAVALWAVGGLLTAATVYSYWQYFSGRSRLRAESVELAQSIREEEQRIDELSSILGGIDLDWQDEQVRFLNQKIAERAFSWSDLFDRLAEVLPVDVRLDRITPSRDRPSVRSLVSGRAGQQEGVELQLSGSARSSEALLGFVEALFQHPAFRRPNPKAERQSDELEFELSVTYLPRRGRQTPERAADGGEKGKKRRKAKARAGKAGQ